ncbi:hypothetical protein J3459_017141 [Metarhizium acridum]|nr:hypothetical protein J3459_017141 [Metarhizium acridum]
MMHVGLGRKHPLHIEYVHLGTCLGFIQDIMTEAILSHPRLHMYRKIALVKALNKVIWIQNDFMAKWHVREADEFGLLESDVLIEKEGYLHGKKILDDKLMADASAGLPTPTHSDEPKKSQCPFASSLPIPSPLRTSIEVDSEDMSVPIPESPKVEVEGR